MKKFRKYIIFFLCIIIVFLVSINVFVIYSHNILSSQVDNLSIVKSKISDLDSFKTIIVNIGHSQKLYLLSQDESYKTQYNSYLSDAYDSLNDLAENNYINQKDKDSITNMLKEYDSINSILLNSKISIPLNSEIQDYLIKSNEIQIEIMHSIADAISENLNNTSESQSSISQSLDNQKNFIHGLSSLITVILGGPMCYILKKYKNGELKLDDIVNALDKEKIKLNNYSNLIMFASILNSHNKEMEKQWAEVSDKVETLETSISTLKNKADNYNISILSDFSSEIQSMEIQLLEIKIMIKQLPSYHEFIVNLTNIIITNKNE